MLLTGLCLVTTVPLSAQDKLIVEPPHWYTGMHRNDLLLVLHEEGIGHWKPELKERSIKIDVVYPCPNPNYLFIQLTWDAVFRPSTIVLKLTKEGRAREIPYTFKARDREFKPAGITHADVMYLITPDRFANGDLRNDQIPGMKQSGTNRKSPSARHGGDLKGITDHINYIHNLGVTTLALNPVYTSDQAQSSYNGYAITDHYGIDPRLGDSTSYRDLVSTAHNKGMKVVKEINFNQVGDNHHLMRDLPFKEWVNPIDGGNHHLESATLVDPYASNYDKKRFAEGWVDEQMPDLNQRDPLLSWYLIQHSLWWIAQYQLDAFRLDGYAYTDQEFMGRLAQEVELAYPRFFMFADIQANSPAVQNWFVGSNSPGNEAKHKLKSVSDYSLQAALEKAFIETNHTNSGVNHIYDVLAADFMQPHADLLVTFVDNQNVSRYFGQVKKDFRKYKAGLAILATTRGIPCLYYGTEILMKETANNDVVRQDFPGGWASDKKNKFLKDGRSRQEREAHDYIKTLFTWRVTNPAIMQGTLTQFVPENGIYTYFRRYGTNVVMVAVNGNAKATTLSLTPYSEFISGKRKAKNVVSGRQYDLDRDWTLDAFEARVVELTY